MENRRLLISFAHPDDESFGLGGLIAKYVAQGVDVYLICATNGDVGTVSPEMLNGYSSVRELRLAELKCASDKLGFKRVVLLGYKDSGMMQDPTTKDPECLWYNWQHTPEAVTRRVVEVLREIRPHVVITFNRYGGYGHPDHIAIQRATTEAFTLAGDAGYLTPGLAPYAPQKLYYNSFPTMLLRFNLLRLRLKGEDPRRMGRNKDIDMQAVLDNVEPIHTKVDIRGYFEAWDEASACHASQGGGGRLSAGRRAKLMRRLLYPHQRFTRVYPQPTRNRIDEYDLFANVKLEDAVAVS